MVLPKLGDWVILKVRLSGSIICGPVTKVEDDVAWITGSHLMTKHAGHVGHMWYLPDEHCWESVEIIEMPREVGDGEI